MSESPATRRLGWFLVTAIVIVVFIIAGILVYEAMQIAPKPSASTSPTASSSTSGGSVTINVYAGEITPNSYGFGNSSDTITSPGPSYTIKSGTVVTVKFTNSGSMGHNWALVTEKFDAASQLAFPGAAVKDGINPVAPGQSGQCTFVASKAGTYYYICQVDGHVTLGLWGYFTVVT